MNRSIQTDLIWFIGITMIAANTLLASNWPQFRGPGGVGISDEKKLPTQ